MNTQMVQRALLVLGSITAVVFLVATVLVGDIRLSEAGASTTEPVMWRIVLVAGGLLIITGLWLVRRSPWAGAGLISLGAVAGTVPIFWTVVMPFVALALVALSAVNARSTAAAA
jgi:hypothetical protein